jgi:hypothetical protein
MDSDYMSWRIISISTQGKTGEVSWLRQEVKLLAYANIEVFCLRQNVKKSLPLMCRKHTSLPKATSLRSYLACPTGQT